MKDISKYKKIYENILKYTKIYKICWTGPPRMFSGNLNAQKSCVV